MGRRRIVWSYQGDALGERDECATLISIVMQQSVNKECGLT